MRAPTITVAGDRRAGEHPGECDLRRGHAVLIADLDQRLDGVPEPVLVVDRRLAPFAGVPGALGRRLLPPVLPRQQAPGQRAPDEQPEPLIDRRGTISYSAERSWSDRYTCWLTRRQPRRVRDPERLHHLPAGEVEQPT